MNGVPIKRTRRKLWSYLIAGAWDGTAIRLSHERAAVSNLLSYPMGTWGEPRIPLSKMIVMRVLSHFQWALINNKYSCAANSLMYWARGYSLPCQSQWGTTMEFRPGFARMCKEAMCLHRWQKKNVECKFRLHRAGLYIHPGWPGGLSLAAINKKVGLTTEKAPNEVMPRKREFTK